MTDKFGSNDAPRGDACSNIHPPNNYTCPGCYRDHDVPGVENGAKFIRCECGAPLRLEIEEVPNYRATIADEDEEEEAIHFKLIERLSNLRERLDDDTHIPDAENPENETGFASFNDTMS